VSILQRSRHIHVGRALQKEWAHSMVSGMVSTCPHSLQPNSLSKRCCKVMMRFSRFSLGYAPARDRWIRGGTAGENGARARTSPVLLGFWLTGGGFVQPHCLVAGS